jgi:thiol-disulfide isomerase/thioredoxin
MKTSVAKALFNSHSYSEYRKLLTDLSVEGKTTGNEQTEERIRYSALNETRMNRLDKTIKITDQNTSILKSLKNKYIWLVISEGWCADSAQIIPVINQMAAQTNNIELKIVLRDENDALMNHFLTNNTKAIPKLIIINKETGMVLNQWGPRPFGAVEFMKNYKEKFGFIDETAKADLQLWYLHDKGLSTQNEIIDMMLSLE